MFGLKQLELSKWEFAFDGVIIGVVAVAAADVVEGTSGDCNLEEIDVGTFKMELSIEGTVNCVDVL